MNFLTEDTTTLQELSSLKLIEVEKPVISFDVLKKQYIYTFIGKNGNNDTFVVEMRIKKTDIYFLEDIKVYTSTAFTTNASGISVPVIMSSMASMWYLNTVYEQPSNNITGDQVNDNYTSFLLGSVMFPILGESQYNTFILSTPDINF